MKIRLKAVVWKKDTDKDGFIPIAIRITGGGKVAYYNTGIKVPSKRSGDTVAPVGWDGNNFVKPMPNHDIQNARLNKMIGDMEREVLSRELNHQEIDVKIVQNLFKGGITDKSTNFYKAAEKLIATKKGPTVLRYTVELEKIKEFAGPSLSFGEITPKWLTDYYKYLTTERKLPAGKVKKANHHNTAINAFKVIRHTFREAIKAKTMPKSVYPFDEWEYPTYIKPNKEFLTLQECDQLFALLSKDIPAEVRTVTAFFLLECFSAIRVSDWKKYRVEKIAMTREMIFTTTKTGTDVRLPLDLMPSLNRIVDYIADNNIKFDLTPEEANRKLKVIAPMAGISKVLTTHVARHTFATIMLAIGVSRAAISHAMGIREKQVETYAKTSQDILRMSLQRIGGAV